MKALVILLAFVAVASAVTYKGTQTLKVGKKNYKCAFNIQYSTDPAKCQKKTVKCKPALKKATNYKIEHNGATISGKTAKNKVSSCAVAYTAPTTEAPAPTSGPVDNPPAPGTTEELDCTCNMPLMVDQQPAAGRSFQAKMLRNAMNRQGLLGSLLQNNNGGAGLLGGGNNGGAAGGLAGLLGGGSNGGATGGLTGLLGGGNNGGAAGGLAGLLSGANGGATGGLLGGGAAEGIQNALIQAVIQNAISQALENPESLQEIVNLAISSGMAEETINSLVESGQVEGVAQGLMENLGDGIMDQEAVQAIINNSDLPNVDDISSMLNGMDAGKLDDLLAGVDPSKLDSLLEGVDVQSMAWNMKCRCKKAEETLVTG